MFCLVMVGMTGAAGTIMMIVAECEIVTVLAVLAQALSSATMSLSQSHLHRIEPRRERDVESSVTVKESDVA